MIIGSDVGGTFTEKYQKCPQRRRTLQKACYEVLTRLAKSTPE